MYCVLPSLVLALCPASCPHDRRPFCCRLRQLQITLALHIWPEASFSVDACCSFKCAQVSLLAARVAQWIRRDPPKVEIAGSSPAVSFEFRSVRNWREHYSIVYVFFVFFPRFFYEQQQKESLSMPESTHRKPGVNCPRRRWQCVTVKESFVNRGGTRTRNPQIRSLIRYPLRHAVLSTIAPTGNRTRVSRMGILNDTTTPLVPLQGAINTHFHVHKLMRIVDTEDAC